MDVMQGNDGMKPKESWNAKQVLPKESNAEQVLEDRDLVGLVL